MATARIGSSSPIWRYISIVRAFSARARQDGRAGVALDQQRAHAEMRQVDRGGQAHRAFAHDQHGTSIINGSRTLVQPELRCAATTCGACASSGGRPRAAQRTGLGYASDSVRSAEPVGRRRSAASAPRWSPGPAGHVAHRRMAPLGTTTALTEKRPARAAAPERGRKKISAICWRHGRRARRRISFTGDRGCDTGSGQCWPAPDARPAWRSASTWRCARRTRCRRRRLARAQRVEQGPRVVGQRRQRGRRVRSRCAAVALE